MFAYVRNLAASGEDAYYQVHTSRIFQYLSDDTERVKFDPTKYDSSISYGIAIGRNLVRHQVLLVAGKLLHVKEYTAVSTTCKPLVITVPDFKIISFWMPYRF